MLLMYNHYIYYMILEHQNDPIWVIKGAKNVTFSYWLCLVLVFKSLSLMDIIFKSKFIFTYEGYGRGSPMTVDHHF